MVKELADKVAEINTYVDTSIRKLEELPYMGVREQGDDMFKLSVLKQNKLIMTTLVAILGRLNEKQ